MNVVFICSDSHARYLSGCYGDSVATPHIDSIARDGVRFSNAYCCVPICGPTRAALFAGRYAHELGLWDNANAYNGTPEGWPSFLRQQGVLLTTIGRLDFLPGCELGIEDMRLPGLRSSFDVTTFFRAQETVERRAEYYAYYDIRTREPDTALPDVEDEPRESDITTQAVEWLRRERPADRPWVLYVGYSNPHPEWHPQADRFARYIEKAPPLAPKYLQPPEALHPVDRCNSTYTCAYRNRDETQIQRMHAAYRAVVEEFDEEVGRILQAIRKEKLCEDTMVIYSSDHGESARAHGNLGKCTMYEEAVGIPLVVSGPGIPRGAVVETPVSHVDIFSTIAGATGIDGGGHFRGRSLLPELRGESLGAPETPVFMEYHAGPAPTGMYAVRDGDWKYVEYVGDRPALYNLREDPDEMRDLVLHAPDDPATRSEVERMRELLRRFCDPETVNAAAHADQRRRKADMIASDDLAEQVYLRGYERRVDKLAPWDWSDFEALR